MTATTARWPTLAALAWPSEPLPAVDGGYLDLHNVRNREWKPAQLAAGIEPCAGSTICDTLREVGLPCRHSPLSTSPDTGSSPTMIDRHYGHVARDGREHGWWTLGRH